MKGFYQEFEIVAFLARLLQEVTRSSLSGEEHHTRVRALTRQSLCNFDAIHAGHDHVTNDDVWTELLHLINGGAAVVGDQDFVTGVSKDLSQSVSDEALIVDNEHNRLLATGRQTALFWEILEAGRWNLMTELQDRYEAGKHQQPPSCKAKTDILLQIDSGPARRKALTRWLARSKV
jgi:hypothetical protein